MTPDPWQAEFLCSTSKRESLLCSRRAGKTAATAARLVREALVYPGSDCLVFSPTLRQSTELLREVRRFWLAMDRPVRAVSNQKTCIEFANGSRVISLPDHHEGVVGVGNPRIIAIDEGSRVSDELYLSVNPMLANTNGTLLTLSTPFGTQGWFFGIWDDSAEAVAKRAKLNEKWRRTAITADRCPRISPEFLADQRIELGNRWFEQDYMLKFSEPVDCVFSMATIQAAHSDDVEPLFADMGV